MPEMRFGKVVAKGSTAFCALVAQSLQECVNVANPSLQDRLPRDFIIEEHTRAEFKAAGYVFPNGSVNEGRVVKVLPQTVLWVRSDIARLKPVRAKHITRHEIAHVLPLNKAKKSELMALMVDEEGRHPKSWQAAYKRSPEECHADTMAEAMSGKDSPWDDFEFYGLDVAEADHPKFLEITFRPDPTPPDPPDTPPVLPPDACDEMEAALLAVTEQLADAREALQVAKGWAQQIQQKTGEIDVLAKEIEAL